jgi:prepilin-type N-terminal cleavage/methylation domain-containing protein
MSRLRSEERGMTLVELLAAMAIALIVSFAAFSLIEAVMKRAGEVSSRVETTQRARQAMDNITRDLRSQVCVLRSDGTPAMTTARTVFSASANSITFFGDTADESWKTGTVAMPVATLRTIALTGGTVDPVSKLLIGATIVETTRPGTLDTFAAGAVTFASATGQTTRTELSEAMPVTDPATSKDLPIFTYYAYDTSTPPKAVTVLDPGTAGKRTTRGSTVIRDDITVRTVDQNSANPNPTCT